MEELLFSSLLNREQLSLKEAKELSQKKWEIIVEQGGSDIGIDINPLFSGLLNRCGFCERYREYGYDIPNCSKCEINMGKSPEEDNVCSCWNTGHPFGIWADNQTAPDPYRKLSMEKAQKVLDLINSVEVDEDEIK